MHWKKPNRLHNQVVIYSARLPVQWNLVKEKDKEKRILGLYRETTEL